MTKPLKVKFPRGAMLRNKQTAQLFYVVENPLKCRIFLGEKPAYAITPYVKRNSDAKMPEDMSTVIYEQDTAESLFVIVL
jgi:hypothetical protein